MVSLLKYIPTRPLTSVLPELSKGPPMRPENDFGELWLFNKACCIAEEILADEDDLDLALPHAEVPASEFFKHISADLTEPRRMRCLLGWCGTRSLPSKPPPPDQNSSSAKLEFQALQAGM